MNIRRSPAPPHRPGLLTRVAISAAAAALGLSACLPNDPAEVIEPMAPYEPQAICEPAAKPGTVALSDLIRSRWPGTWTSISRACDVGGRSEHKDGRAIDVGGVSAFNSTRARADSILRWLFDADAAGHRFANARRLGVMYLVWDSHIWVANEADRGWQPYPCSGVTLCHQDHIHISLSQAGAAKQSSYPRSTDRHLGRGAGGDSGGAGW